MQNTNNNIQMLVQDIFQNFNKSQENVERKHQEIQNKIDLQLYLLKPIAELLNSLSIGNVKVLSSKNFKLYRSYEDEILPKEVYLVPYLVLQENGFVKLCLSHPIDFSIFIEEKTLYQKEKVYCLITHGNDSYFSHVGKANIKSYSFSNAKDLAEEISIFIKNSFIK